MRRLSRQEYSSTLRDLLGDTTRPGDALPPDERGNGFGNDSAFQSVSELLAESYARLAEEAALRVTRDPTRLAELLACDVAQLGELACVERFIEHFGARAYRRPLTGDERTRLLGVFADVRSYDGLESALGAVIEVTLQSPQFLYRIEETPPAAGTEVARLGAFELASRLSYLLWGSMPDEELFRAAGAGELETPEQLQAQAQRMLEHPEARARVRDFHGLLFGLEGLEQVRRSPSAFPELPQNLGALLREETSRFVEDVVFEQGGGLSALLTSPQTFLNQELAGFYGVPDVQGAEFRPVSLDEHRRAGILTHGAVMNAHTPGVTSHPVLRGLLVRSVLLCDPPPDPPPGIVFIVPSDPGLSTRERYGLHRSSDLCAGCHQFMDPLGFGFENYDPVGRWREHEGGLPIDASGEIVGTDVAGPFVGPRELAERLAQSETVANCYVEQWFAYGYGRVTTPEDMCSRDQLRQAFRAGDQRITDLILALTETDAFLRRRVEP